MEGHNPNALKAVCAAVSSPIAASAPAVEERETNDHPNQSKRHTRHRDYWLLTVTVPIVEEFQQKFELRNEDIWIASAVKTGTTWMKALLHCMLSLVSSTPDSLHLHSPHSLVPSVDLRGERPEVPTLPRRILHTHLPFHALPLCLQHSSRLKIVYIVRNPRDTVVSYQNFDNRVREPFGFRILSKEDLFDAFCRGEFQGGPFVENLLSYWREYKKNPERVLWLSYEDLQSDCAGFVVRIGRFLGFPCDVIETNASAIAERWSFCNLANAEINKTGVRRGIRPSTSLPNSVFFRKGKSGEWRDHLDKEMVHRIHSEIELKLEEHGIHFRY